jgi:hypothetical protein
MAYCAGHAVLVSGLPLGAGTGDLLDALLAAGHRPLAVGAPTGGAPLGRRYVIFQNAAEADAACRQPGALHGLGQAIAVSRLFGAGQSPVTQAASGMRAPAAPPTSARREAGAAPQAASPSGPSGTGASGDGSSGRAVLVRGLRIGAHPGHILDTFTVAGLRPEVVRTTDASVARGRCIITFRDHRDAARAVELDGALRCGGQALRVIPVACNGGADGLDDLSSDEERPPRPDVPWSEAAARVGVPDEVPSALASAPSSVTGRYGVGSGGAGWRPALGAAPSAAASPAARRVSFAPALPAGAGGHGSALAHEPRGVPAAAALPGGGSGPGLAPPPPPPPPTPAPAGPAGAGRVAPAAALAAPVDLLYAALRPLLLPHTTARDGITIHRVWGLKFHEEYYGVYVQVAHRGVLFEGHISVLHCVGCTQRLSPVQVRRMEARCWGLRGLTVTLAHVGMVLDRRFGRVHRGWCIVHTGSAISHDLWTIRGFLSNWIPEATSLENRESFHLSFDKLAG